MMTSTVPHGRDPDPRVVLAAERTLLAWIRTGVALMGFGFVVARFGWFLREMAALGGGDGNTPPSPPQWAISHEVGVTLIVLAVVVNVTAAVWYMRFVERYRRGETAAPRRLSLSVVLSGALAALGVGLAWYLLRLA